MDEVTNLAGLTLALEQPIDSVEVRPRVVRVGNHLLFQAVADGSHADMFVRRATLHLDVLLGQEVVATREWPLELDLSGVEPFLIQAFWTDALAEIGVDSRRFGDVSFRCAFRSARSGDRRDT
jgi:hypothetical protein